MQSVCSIHTLTTTLADSYDSKSVTFPGNDCRTWNEFPPRRMFHPDRWHWICNAGSTRFDRTRRWQSWWSPWGYKLTWHLSFCLPCRSEIYISSTDSCTAVSSRRDRTSRSRSPPSSCSSECWRGRWPEDVKTRKNIVFISIAAQSWQILKNSNVKNVRFTICT